MISKSQTNAQTEVLKPQILYALYFNCPETSEYDLSQNVPSNVHLCSGPDLEVDYEFAVKQVNISMEHYQLVIYILLKLSNICFQE